MSARRQLRLFDPSNNPITDQLQPPHASVNYGAPPQTGGEVIARYLDDLDLRRQCGKVSAAHHANYRSSLVAAKKDGDGNGRYVGFVEVVGPRPIGELIQHDITFWFSKNKKWKSPETRRRNLAAVLACFNWAAEEGLIKSSPYRKTARLKEEKVKRRDATDAEAEAIWSAAPESLRRIMWLVDVAGLRTKEARELLWAHIDWDRGVIVLKEHKTRHLLADPQDRYIALDERALAELRLWLAASKPNQSHVFLTTRGRVWSKGRLDEEFRKVRVKCGLPKDLTPYCFRHRFGTAGILTGLTEREVGDLMGHKDTAMTRRYTHTGQKVDHLRLQAEKLSLARVARRALPLRDADGPFPLFEVGG